MCSVSTEALEWVAIYIIINILWDCDDYFYFYVKNIFSIVLEVFLKELCDYFLVKYFVKFLNIIYKLLLRIYYKMDKYLEITCTILSVKFDKEQNT